ETGHVYGAVQLTFADFETADNFVQGTFTVTADLNVSELPQASVVASASRTAFAGGNAQVTVSYDGSSFTIAAESDDLEAEEYPTATLSITNPDGVKLSVNMSETQNGDDYELAGTVSVGGTAVGTIEETDNGLVLVRYTDGTFETLY
ncbi:MAG: hypothetical protein OQK77_08285, partial [Psychromonas sp.]|nr:hypothetical protein [Psychromonas sp.]